MYLKSTYESGINGTFTYRYGMTLLVIVLLRINVINPLGPLSTDDTNISTAISAMVAYFLFAIINSYRIS
jgi:hypothetical protein